MIVRPIKTDRILHGEKSIHDVLEAYLPELKNNSVVVLSSKLVAICENRVVPFDEMDLDSLTKREADFYLPDSFEHKFTIKINTLIVRAGIDKNFNRKYYILWPKDPQASADSIREYLVKKTGLSDLGVIITDSISTPLRRGVTGIAIAYSGFRALNDYTKTSRANIAGGLAAAAVVTMGEGRETTPIALIEDVPFVSFLNHNPTKPELEDYYLTIEEDIYEPFLSAVTWEKGKSGLG
jgi:F420-0:gamma-glutamyl ligase